MTPGKRGGPRPGHARRTRLPSAPYAGSRRRALTDEGVLACEQLEGSGDLPPPWHSELLPENVAMRLHGSRRDAELDGDLVVRAPERDQLDNLALPLREP
jgi:hypothetical protein